VFSLPLTGIVLYSRHEHLKGYDILLNGWAAALYHLNFAWFANVCFLYCARRVPLGWPLPVKSAVVAALLSLDTFGLSSVTMDEGGATTLVYAYGWGAFLWFLGIKEWCYQNRKR